MWALILCAWFGWECADKPLPPMDVNLNPPVVMRPTVNPPKLNPPEIHEPILLDPDCEKQPPREYANLFFFAAKRWGIDECVQTHAAWVESRFDPNAFNKRSKAAGMVQIVPATAAEYGVDPYDPRQAIMFQARYIAWNLDRWLPDIGGRTFMDLLVLALAGYNWGFGNMLESQKLHGWITWAEARPHMPQETRDYVWQILGV